jgi:hypothetical protein
MDRFTSFIHKLNNKIGVQFMPNIIITKGTYDKFLALRLVFKHLLEALAENSIKIVDSIYF